MKKLNLDFCAECSKWEPLVKCKKTGKLLNLNISFCFENEKYFLDSIAYEEGCIAIEETLEKPKDEMESFINQNFEVIDNFECIPFSTVIDFCPSCNRSEEPGL